MATKHTTSSGGKQNTQRSNGDSARWIAGLLLFFIGLYATASVLFYFISWSSDQSVLQGVGADDPRFDGAVENLCGRAGARLGELFVGRGFGVPGILLPVMLMLIGVRIIRRKALLFNHSILSLFLIMILASLTLGFAFGDKWSLCSSSGWGGALGIEVARMLGGRIGAFGMLILLAGGWILTGVFINRNFINTVNSAGNAMVDRGGRIVEIVKHKVVAHHAQDEAFDDPEPEAPRPRREPDPVPDAAPAREAETPADREAAPLRRTAATKRRRPQRARWRSSARHQPPRQRKPRSPRRRPPSRRSRQGRRIPSWSSRPTRPRLLRFPPPQLPRPAGW